jgi:hypothetical protein
MLQGLEWNLSSPAGQTGCFLNVQRQAHLVVALRIANRPAPVPFIELLDDPRRLGVMIEKD